MFTGLIEEIGVLKNISSSQNGTVLTISCSKVLSDVVLGASIAVNGVCQTVVGFGSGYFVSELSNETLNVSNFQFSKAGDKVNLERALLATARLDGHIVSGHVDSMASFVQAKKDGFSYKYSFLLDKATEKYVVYKGSITINGISLTVSELKDGVCSVEVIPATIENTNLSSLKSGEKVNIETDIIGKYVEKFLLLNNNGTTTTIDENMLKVNGFL